jgi:formiminotetrahydrofolate cyclodeaminase
MSRSKKAAEATEATVDSGYDEQMAARAEAMQNRPEELAVKTGEIIQSVADATRMPESTEQPAKKPFQVVRGWTTRNCFASVGTGICLRGS